MLHAPKLFTHFEDGGLYRVVRPALLIKLKRGDLWVPGVVYEDIDVNSGRFGQLYGTSVSRWVDCFAGFTAP